MTNSSLPRPGKKEFEKFRKIKAKVFQSEEGSTERNQYFSMQETFDMSAEVFELNEKYGIKNAIGEIILEPEYDNFRMLSSEELDTGDRVVAEADGRWGILRIDGKGSWIIQPEYDYIGYPNNITHLRKGDKWSIMDISKMEILVDACDRVDDNMGFLFTNGVGFFEKQGKDGVIMEWGQHTDAIFDDIDFDPDMYVKVLYEGKWGYINEKNQFTEDEDEAAYYPTDI